MEKQCDLKFCNITHSDEDKEINIEKEFLTRAYNFNKEFAKIEIPKFEVRLVYSRKKMDELWGSKTKDYVSAFVKNNSIVIFAYEVFNKETKWQKEDFFKTLIHEINHLFYQELRDDTYDPLWLSEGLATFMQHNKEKFNYKDKLKITKEILSQSSEDMTFESYQIFTIFTEYLILEFGEEKILELIESLKNNGKLENLFQKIYRKSFDELIKNGNKYHKIT